jgi:hypothetical protein
MLGSLLFLQAYPQACRRLRRSCLWCWRHGSVGTLEVHLFRCLLGLAINVFDLRGPALLPWLGLLLVQRGVVVNGKNFPFGVGSMGSIRALEVHLFGGLLGLRASGFDLWGPERFPWLRLRLVGWRHCCLLCLLFVEMIF